MRPILAEGLEAIKEEQQFKKDVFYHYSPTKNRESILKDGLSLDTDPSGYGPAPEKKAIYLAHSGNVNLHHEFLKKFGDFDVFEVSGLLPEFAVADEDSGKGNWLDSINRFGTFGYTKDIPAKQIKFGWNVNRELK